MWGSISYPNFGVPDDTRMSPPVPPDDPFTFDLVHEVAIELADPEGVAGMEGVVQVTRFGSRARFPERPGGAPVPDAEWEEYAEGSEDDVTAWSNGADLAYLSNRREYLRADRLLGEARGREASDENARLRRFYGDVVERLVGWFVRRGYARPTDDRDPLRFTVEGIVLAVAERGPDYFASNKALYNWAADWGRVPSNAADPSNSIRKSLARGFRERYGFDVPETPSAWFDARERIWTAHTLD